MLKLVRNGIMKRFVLEMAAFVSESPATCDPLPRSSCSPPFFGLFPQTSLGGCFLLDTFVLRFSPFLSLPSSPPPTPPHTHIHAHCWNLNFLSSYQVWTDFPFRPKGVLEWLQAITEWVRNLCPVAGLVILAGSPSPLPLGHWELLLLTLQSLLVTWSL